MSDWKKELRELVELKEMGAITQEQFESERDGIFPRRNQPSPDEKKQLTTGGYIGNFEIFSVIGEGG